MRMSPVQALEEMMTGATSIYQEPYFIELSSTTQDPVCLEKVEPHQAHLPGLLPQLPCAFPQGLGEHSLAVVCPASWSGGGRRGRNSLKPGNKDKPRAAGPQVPGSSFTLQGPLLCKMKEPDDMTFLGTSRSAGQAAHRRVSLHWN
ncbi:uncharacterized protein LOC143644907 isoform X1 [Tamandua tetradactyla]|uniref:uncharacterized protein LOC143644907 isoform X1 n=1 Tax=Tamandua tetradactyla TaxID=48850 RepID=UPI0040547ED7